MYPDYGNEEKVPIDKLRIIVPPENDVLINLPFLAFPVRLCGDIKWSAKIADFLLEHLNEEVIKMKVVIAASPNNIPTVELIRPNSATTINQLLEIESKKAIEQKVDQAENSKINGQSAIVYDASCDDALADNKPIPKFEVPKMNQQGIVLDYDVYVSFAASPFNFYVRPYTMLEKFEELQRDLNDFYDKEENLIPEILQCMLRKGIYVAVKYEGIWYRGMIVSNDSEDMIACKLIDVGIMKIFDLQHLQPLYNMFKITPVQAVKAALHGKLYYINIILILILH